MSNLTCQLEEDQEFKEFLSVHQRRDQAPTWANDTVQTSAAVGVQLKSQSKKKDVSDDYLNFDSDDSDVGEEEDEQAEEKEEVEEDDNDDEGGSSSFTKLFPNPGVFS